MDEAKVILEARRLYGDVVTSVTTAGDCVISVKENGHYLPMGFGDTWEDALIDCACQFAFAEECSHA